MKPDILLIHGAGEGTYEWTLPRITPINELLDHYRFHFPRMPKPEDPNYSRWSRQLREELTHLDDQAILVGHSLGGSVLLKYFSELETAVADNSYKALFLLATPFWGAAEWDYDEFKLKEGFEHKLKMFSNIFILHNEDDDVVPFGHHEIYADKIPGCKVHTFKTGAHLSVENMKIVVNKIRK